MAESLGSSPARLLADGNLEGEALLVTVLSLQRNLQDTSKSFRHKRVEAKQRKELDKDARQEEESGAKNDGQVGGLLQIVCPRGNSNERR